jgi:site-specific DNA recombinase
VIRSIFGWYTGGAGLGFNSIADRLNREGVVTPQAKGWAMSSIRVIIMNQVYFGRVVWNRRRMGKFHRIADRCEVERDGCGKRRLKWNDPQVWLVFENAHEALMDRDTFDRAQRILEQRGNHRKATGFLTGKAKTSPYLLSGLVSCGACGGSMHGRTTWKNKWRKDGTRIGTKYYVCSAAITKGKTVCKPIQFLQRKLDDYVLDFVVQRIGALLGARGRDALHALIERQLAPAAPDPGPGKNRLRAPLSEWGLPPF